MNLLRKYFLKICWFINRLSKMPLDEILYRLQQKKHIFYDKYLVAHTSVPDCDILKDYNLIVETFYCFQNKINRESFEKVKNDFVNIFGISVDCNQNLDWHKDPKTKNKWPLKFWSDIDIRDGFTYGGAKFVWELNRFYFLPGLAFRYFYTKDTKYAEKIFLILDNWLKNNPYSYGVNWTSGIELSIRVSNLIWAIFYLRDYKIKSESIVVLKKFLFYHAHHLYRYQSKYSSNNNHAIAEAFGLFVIGVFFPSFPNAQKWKECGQSILERECLRQINIDGGSYECSTTYLSFVLDFFLLFRIICRKNNITYDHNLDSRLEKSCDYIKTLLDKNGNVPNIGDQDSAILINFGLDNIENFKSILNTCGILYDRPDLCCENFPDLKTKILVGDNVIDEFIGKLYLTQIDNSSNSIKCTKFTDSGLFVIKEVNNEKETLLVCNATPMGMPPLFAHGHLDALSFYLTANGNEIFVDPGTYLYHSGGSWRKYFRSTGAHNTVRIDGKELTDMPGDFMYGKPYEIIKNVYCCTKNKTIWSAQHNAYQKNSDELLYEREIVWFNYKYCLHIKDIFVTNKSRLIEMFFHFHPECSVELIDSNVVVKRKGVKFMITFNCNLECELFYGSERPIFGWYSKSFNIIEKTNTLVCRKVINKSDLIETYIKWHYL